MPKRTPRRARPPMLDDPMALPLLAVMVAAVVILGALEYWLLLAIGSAAYIGFVGWKRWRPAPRARASRTRPARPQRSTRRARPPSRRTRRR